MKDYNKKLREEFIRRHGNKKWSIEHNFIAVERERIDGNVIVGYSYTFFGSADYIIYQYSIPEEEWDNPDLFITFKNKVSPRKHFPDGYFCEIAYNLSTNAFYSSLTIDNLSTVAERNHRENPPYLRCDKLPLADKFDYDDEYFSEGE